MTEKLAKEKEVTLGSEVKDSVTDFKGIAVGRSEWIAGCDRIAVQAKVKKNDLAIPDAQWVDEPQIIIIKKARKAPVKKKVKPGGPSSPVPKRKSDDRR